MGLQERLMDDLKEAMRKNDDTRRLVIRNLRSAINYEEIAKQKTLDDVGVVGVISRQVKEHKESIDLFRKGKREDLVAKEEVELALLLAYLPQQMSREELVETARKIIAEVGAKGPGDKGKVMGRLMPQVKGKAEGSEVNTVVTELLAASTGV